MLIVLDTNLIPRKGTLRNVEIATILRVAHALGARAAITQTVLAESVSARRREFQKSLDEYDRATQRLSEYHAVTPAYIASADLVAAEWEAQLRATFEVLELQGEDAIEALEREASRIKPVKVDGTGARDAAIWLAVKRSHLSGSDVTHFASNNSADFGIRKSSPILHPDLAEELGDSSERFHYHTTLASIINTICSKAEISVSPAWFTEDLLLSLTDQIVGHNSLSKFADFAGLTPDQVGPIEQLLVSDTRVRDAYSAPNIIVGFLSAEFTLALAREVHETLGTAITGRLGGWFEIEKDVDAVAAFDVTLLRDVQYQRDWTYEEDPLSDAD